MSENLLEVRGLSASYGAIQALSKVSLNVPRGSIVALLGSNGAGKSTTLNAVCRLIDASAGEVIFDGEPIHRLASEQIVRRGMVQVPEGREVFKDMSVRENLELGAFLRRNRRETQEDFERVYAMFPRLRERAEQRASTLSGGEQQMLAIGRALMARPRMILFDEPPMGLSPLLIEQIFETIVRLNREEGLTILLVEQDVRLALATARHAYILENGEVTLSGPAQFDDPQVAEVWDRLISVNLEGLFNVTHAFVPALKARRGCIVNLSSIVAFVSGISTAGYVASKGAVRSLTQVLARDLAPHGVRTNAVAPGLMLTEMVAPQLPVPGGIAWSMDRLPLKRAAE